MWTDGDKAEAEAKALDPFAHWRKFRHSIDDGFNYSLSFDWGYISFNPKRGRLPLDGILEIFDEEVYEGAETALCLKRDRRYWFILKGDWREGFESAAKLGPEAALEFYANNRTFMSPNSTEWK